VHRWLQNAMTHWAWCPGAHWKQPSKHDLRCKWGFEMVFEMHVRIKFVFEKFIEVVRIAAYHTFSKTL
jgi:hypothetical protein